MKNPTQKMSKKKTYNGFESSTQELPICDNCFGRGYVITCLDDMCAGEDECIHGDGEEDCPVCSGRGEIYPDEFDGEEEVRNSKKNGETKEDEVIEGLKCEVCVTTEDVVHDEGGIEICTVCLFERESEKEWKEPEIGYLGTTGTDMEDHDY